MSRHDGHDHLTEDPPSHSNNNSAEHHHDDEKHQHQHAAKHQLEHRLTEKAGFGVAEHIVDTSERFLERGVEAAGERLMERSAEAASERLLERSTEVLSERLSERTAQSGSERLLERGAEVASERLLERGTSGLIGRSTSGLIERGVEAAGERALERGAEVASERLLERSAEAASERLLERSAEAVGERFVQRGAQTAVQFSEKAVLKGSNEALDHSVNTTVHIGAVETVTHSMFGSLSANGCFQSALKMFHIALPILGTGFIAHMAHQDWHRLHHEWKEHGICITVVLFLLAALCDTFDMIVHMVVVTNLTIYHVDHHLLHILEHASIFAAVIALSSMISGELLAARRSASSKTKSE